MLSFSIYIISLFLVILLFLILKIKFYLQKSILVYILTSIIISYFIISLLLSNVSIGYIMVGSELRYTGLFISPTVFGIVSILIYIFFVKYIKNKILIFIIYFILFYLIYLTKSRLDVALVIIFPILILLHKYNLLKNKKIIFTTIMIISMSFYPIYTYFKINYDIQQQERADASDSDNTRIFYSLELVNQIEKNNYISFFLGNGANSSVNLIGGEHKPHNDFLRIIYDYGIVFFIIFMYALYKIYIINIYSSISIIVYMFSFYHNMIFDIYVVILILIILSIIPQEKRQ
jgi:hypothetical protein